MYTHTHTYAYVLILRHVYTSLYMYTHVYSAEGETFKFLAYLTRRWGPSISFHAPVNPEPDP